MSTVQKLHSDYKAGNRIEPFDVVVMDEAHKAVAPTYRLVIEESLNPIGGRLLGLTATPGRAMDDTVENRAVAEMFHNKLCGLTFSGDDDGVMGALQKRGILARVIRKPIETELDLDLASIDLTVVAGNDLSHDALAAIARDRNRNLQIADALLELARQGRRTVVFATNVEHSRMLAAFLMSAGYSAAHVDGETPSEIRTWRVNQFVAGEIQFLINFDVFSTGFDAPETDAVVIARPTASIVLYSQMIGRGLRGPMVGGKPICFLVDVVDNLSRFEPNLDDVYRFFDDYWS